MLNWATSPHVKRLNMAFVLVDEKLADLSDRLTGNPHVAAIEVPLPDEGRAADVHPGVHALGRDRGVLRFRRGGAGDAHGRHLADRPQRAASVGARKRAQARLGRVPIAEEAAARTAVPRAAGVHRAEVDARHRRRTRSGEGAAAGRRGAAQTRRARQPADGLPAVRARSAPASRFWRSASAARSACRA